MAVHWTPPSTAGKLTPSAEMSRRDGSCPQQPPSQTERGQRRWAKKHPGQVRNKNLPEAA